MHGIEWPSMTWPTANKAQPILLQFSVSIAFALNFFFAGNKMGNEFIPVHHLIGRHRVFEFEQQSNLALHWKHETLNGFHFSARKRRVLNLSQRERGERRGRGGHAQCKPSSQHQKTSQFPECTTQNLLCEKASEKRERDHHVTCKRGDSSI